MSLNDKHLVISGGGSGVGAQIVRTSALAGARVTILGRRPEPLAHIAEETGAYAIPCDVTDAKAVERALQQARDINGPINVAVANAGDAQSQPFHKMDSADLHASLAVNVSGVFHLWQQSLEDLRANQWGRLIVIASTAGLKGYPYVSAYCAAKHAAVGLMRSVAIELANTGITANAICPGFVDTPLLTRSLAQIQQQTGRSEEQARKALLAGNPQRRFIQPVEVAAAVNYLCSSSANCINGHTLTLSGGEI